MKPEWISLVFFVISAILHIGFFIAESFIMQRPEYQKKLKLTDQEFKKIKPWIFNQGFYNLFLALGVFMGLALIFKKQVVAAGALTGFCGLSMMFAGVVLFINQPHLRKWALLQFLPPLIGFIFLSQHVR